MFLSANKEIVFWTKKLLVNVANSVLCLMWNFTRLTLFSINVAKRVWTRSTSGSTKCSNPLCQSMETVTLPVQTEATQLTRKLLLMEFGPSKSLSICMLNHHIFDFSLNYKFFFYIIHTKHKYYKFYIT